MLVAGRPRAALTVSFSLHLGLFRAQGRYCVSNCTESNRKLIIRFARTNRFEYIRSGDRFESIFLITSGHWPYHSNSLCLRSWNNEQQTYRRKLVIIWAGKTN